MALRMQQLGIEQAAFRVEYLDIADLALVITDLGEAGIVHQGVDAALLGHQFLAEFHAGDERIIDFTKRDLDGLGVADQGLALDRLRGAHLTGGQATGEDRTQCIGADTPDLG